jgi:hypothetical protein
MEFMQARSRQIAYSYPKMRTRSLSILFLPLAIVASFLACGDTTSNTGSSGNGTSSGGGASSSGSTSSSSGGASSSSSSGGATDAGCGTPPVPVLDGGGPCGTTGFGSALVTFVQTDAGSDQGYDGGALEPGTYDAVFAERSSTLRGSWRETLVIDALQNYTRTRQIDSGSDAGLGPVTYRSGKLSTAGNQLTLQESCAVSGDAGVAAGRTTLPFDTQSDSCGTVNLRFGVTGIRVTLKKRR